MSRFLPMGRTVAAATLEKDPAGDVWRAAALDEARGLMQVDVHACRDGRRQLELEAAAAELLEPPDEDAHDLLRLGALWCGDAIGHRFSGLVIGSRCPGTTPPPSPCNRSPDGRAAAA